jgi:hypothetical protein
MPDSPVAREYVVARKVLLDALQLLAPQSTALVLVGAQAIYLQTPTFDGGLPASTTDGDIAIDPDILFENPDLARVLEAAGFRPHTSPGTWFSPDGVPIDLMVPAGALPTSSRRTAPLTGQSSSTARRTAGLELALIDNSLMTLQALDPQDPRTVAVKVASPAALVVAKLTKLSERISDARPDRILAKDASDLLRILRYTDAAMLGMSLRTHSEAAVASRTIEAAVQFLKAQLVGRSSPMIELAVEYHQQFETAAQITTSFRTLAERLIEAFSGSGSIKPADSR